MIFSTFEFIIFLVVLILLYYQVNKNHQWFLMLLASSAFLGYLSVNFLVYTILIILANYALGLIIERQNNPSHKRQLYILGMILNIGQLVFFKYINFLIENLNIFLGLFEPGEVFPYMNIILPVGISYYTFECIGYQIDIYRGSSRAEKHLGVFASYILFFPKLLAGPIERSKTFIPALKKAYSFQPTLFVDGLVQMFWGFFKKLVVADRIAAVIQTVYGNVDEFTGIPLLITLVLQVFHMYCDFSGYTDIALGIGKLFGLRLTNNFDRPLFAQNISMFWRKWHISLTNWCNDYIFKRILLRRMRWKKWAAVYGVFMTFLIIGIWHGAGWNYVILGAMQGIAINYEFFTKRKRLQIASRLNPYWVKLFSRGLVFIFFAFTLVFFNSASVTDAFFFISHIFRGITMELDGLIGDMGFGTRIDGLIIIWGILTVMTLDYINEKQIRIRQYLNSKPFLKWSLYYGLIISVLILGKTTTHEFIYLQF
jgi:D-alanyl-lipoteichoic acid acyltransferase DltB (MBOAT superfamily)